MQDQSTVSISYHARSINRIDLISCKINQPYRSRIVQEQSTVSISYHARLPFISSWNLRAFSLSEQCHWFAKQHLIPARLSNIAVSNGFSNESIVLLLQQCKQDFII